jgi:DNA-binding PadR family transcriptional regulator
MLLWEYFAVFVFCLIGCSFMAWKIGKEQGIYQALTYLEDEGIVEFDPEDKK